MDQAGVMPHPAAMRLPSACTLATICSTASGAVDAWHHNHTSPACPGHFEVLSKKVGVPLVCFRLKKVVGSDGERWPCQNLN